MFADMKTSEKALTLASPELPVVTDSRTSSGPDSLSSLDGWKETGK